MCRRSEPADRVGDLLLHDLEADPAGVQLGHRAVAADDGEDRRIADAQLRERVAELLGLARLEREERAVGGVVGLDVVEVGEHLHVVARALDVDQEDDAALLVEALGDELGRVGGRLDA